MNLLPSRHVPATVGLFEGGGLFRKKYFRVGTYYAKNTLGCGFMRGEGVYSKAGICGLIVLEYVSFDKF